MKTDPALYLDHAATSFPKAPGVVDAVTAWYHDLGVSASRGDALAAEGVADAVAHTRARLARLCGVPADRVLFTSGATESINLALRGLFRSGPLQSVTASPNVLTTDIEHNAVARTLVDLGARIDRHPCDADGRVDSRTLAARIAGDDRPDLVVISHASNVTGSVVDLAPIATAARGAGIPTVLDASQTAGALALDATGFDMVAASSHKALLGPPGLGFLAIAPGLDLPHLRTGGTGSSTTLDSQPDDWPGGREPGTPNTPAILGLGAALTWAEAATVRLEDGRNRQRETVDRLVDVLTDLGLTLHHDPGGLPVLAASFPAGRGDPTESGMLLAECGITARSGYCCAPWIHARLGPDAEAAGVLRLSPGPFIDPRAAAEAVARCLDGGRPGSTR